MKRRMNRHRYGVPETEEFQGQDITITHYEDGSTKLHGGGPVGDVYYNRYGEETSEPSPDYNETYD